MPWSIELTNDYTILFCSYTGSKNKYINVESSIHLRANINGANSEYPFVKAENIPISPSKYNFQFDQEEIKFKLFFKRVGANVQKIDLIECIPNKAGCLNVYDIELKHFLEKSSTKNSVGTEKGSALSVSTFGQESILPAQLLLNEPTGFLYNKNLTDLTQTSIKISAENKYLAYLPASTKKEDGSYSLVIIALQNKKEICSVNIKDFSSCQLDFEFSKTNTNILFLQIKRLLERKSECCVYNYDFFKVDVNQNKILDSFAWEDETKCFSGGSESNFFKAIVCEDENTIIKFHSFCEDKDFLKNPSTISLKNRSTIGGTDSYTNYGNILATNGLKNYHGQIKGGVLNENGDKYVFEANRKLYIINTIGTISKISQLSIPQVVIQLIDFKNNKVFYKTNNVDGNYLDGKDEIWEYDIVNGSKNLLKIFPLEGGKPKTTYQIIGDKIVTKFEIREPNNGEIRTQYNFYRWSDFTPYLTLKVSNRPLCFFSKDLNFMYFLNSTSNDIATQLFVSNISYDPNQPKNRTYEVRDYKKYADGYEPLSLWKIWKDQVAENMRNSSSSSESSNSDEMRRKYNSFSDYEKKKVNKYIDRIKKEYKYKYQERTRVVYQECPCETYYIDDFEDLDLKFIKIQAKKTWTWDWQGTTSEMSFDSLDDAIFNFVMKQYVRHAQI